MPLRVILVDDRQDRAALLGEALDAQGFAVVAALATGADLPRRIAELAADVIIVDIDSPDRDSLEGMRRITFEQKRPVVMFTEDGSSAAIKAAIEAGVSAYVVDGLRPDRVRPVVEVAIARFKQFHELRSELDRANSTLAERKLVDRAKVILMKNRHCNEAEAHRLMQKMAMDQKLRLVDLANKVIDAAALLGL